MSTYRIVRRTARLLIPLVADCRVEGLENIPRAGPFVLVLNHQSLLDPIVAQAICPRHVHSMTKSTQFNSPLFRWLLPRLNAFPTRRYRVDPQSVRVALRVLGRGGGLGIYPEGERSWDGRLQPLRRGTVRLLLKAGVAVVPCGITGTYGVLPRWSRSLRRGRVVLRFGAPLHFGKHDDRAAREAALPEATRRIRAALTALGGGSPGPDDPPDEGAEGAEPAEPAESSGDRRGDDRSAESTPVGGRGERT